MSTTKTYLTHWSQKYKSDLLTNILPFWFEHGLDNQNGGIFTCLDRDGDLMDSEKSVWFQGRFAFMAAHTYNKIEQNPVYLQGAKSAIDFIENHCFDADGHMFFQVTAQGVPVRKRRYFFSETFAAIAFSEYSIASGDTTYALKALELFKKILHYREHPELFTPKYREGLQAKGHSICMILINTAFHIREAIQDPILTKVIDDNIAEIERDFMKPEFGAVLEMVSPKGEFIDSNAGRCINPGHSIETAWFILEEAKYRGWDKRLIDIGIKIFDWSWEWGWDKEFGGILYFRDCKNRPPQEYWHDMKFWWPQNEAVIATLFAYQATQNPKYLDLHKQINDYMYDHFPDDQYPEWFGYLHRDGTPTQMAKGNMYKGPFHIPRMMLKSSILCDELCSKL